MTKLTKTVVPTLPRYCAFCAMHNHTLCSSSERCECGRRAHNPTVEIAALMGDYERPDLRAGSSIEKRATRWRQKDEQS